MRTLISIIVLFSPLSLFCQELEVSVNKNPALTNEVIQLQFSINAKGNDFIPPSLSNFHILSGPSQGFSQSYSMINGKTSKEIKTTISYSIQAKKEGKYIIGPASVKVDNKSIKSKNLEIIIKSTNKENKNFNNKKQVFIKSRINKSNIFVGEQISATSKIYIKDGIKIQNSEVYPVTYDGFWEDEIEINNKPEREIINGIAYNVIKFKHSVLTAQKSGNITIPASEINVSIPTRGRLISNHPFFGPQYETILRSENLKSSSKKIKVKEIPKPFPKTFYGTVSEKFRINTNVDRTQVKTSEAIIFKLIFRGKGNINMLDPFEIKFPSSFEVFEPTIIDKTYVGNNNTNGTKTFEYILIAREKGNFKIPEIKFNYFNPKTEKYVEVTTKEYFISVEKGKEYIPTDTNEIALQNLNLLQNTELLSINRRELISKWYSSIYWSIFSLIITSFLVAFILSKRNINPIEVKKRKSTKIAMKRLKNARFCLKNDNYEQFFEEIEKSLWGYFADKFELNSSKLSKETINLHFNKKDIETEIKNNFVSLLNICEFARYSPSKNKHEHMEKTLDDAKEIIIAVESNIKKK